MHKEMDQSISFNDAGTQNAHALKDKETLSWLTFYMSNILL